MEDTPTTPPTTVQKLAAEALGSLLLVGLGVGSIFAFGAGSDGTPQPLVFGLALAAAMFAFGRYTEGHFNPAVSLGSALSGRTAWSDALAYMGAQLAGAILAVGVILVLALGFDGFEAFDTPLGANSWGDDGSGYSLWAAVLLQIVLTLILVLGWLGITDRRSDYLAFAPIGAGFLLYGLYAVSVSAGGDALNPARSIGAALFSGGDPLIQVWVFIIGPLIGAAAAGFLYPALFGADRETVPGAGLNFSSGSKAPAAGAPGYGGYPGQGGYEQPWANQPAAGQAAQPAQGGYAPGGYQAPAAAQPVQQAAPAQAQPEQPIIQDGWQWDPQAQQWIPAQQHAAPPAADGWSDSAGDRTQIRPGE